LEKIATQADMQMLGTVSCNREAGPVAETGAIAEVYKQVSAHFRRRITLQEIVLHNIAYPGPIDIEYIVKHHLWEPLAIEDLAGLLGRS
jgi:hypothetical protein